MTPRKTELALTTLQSRRSPLTLLQRRALILPDGQRDLVALAVLPGGDGAALVHSLCAMGYLDLGADAGRTPGPTSRAAAPAAPPVQAETPTTQAGAALTEEDPHRLRRRAATSARLYLLDILQLQRNPAAVVLHRQLQAARSEEQIAAAIAEALQALPQITSASYTERVRTRIGELLPQALQAA
ncbi:hypothetical protein A7D16_14565 [Xanthomonas nasturtii]|uniref:hypothetical protein n=1 Tax=Xanthomonas nasturtii TaxID=1843581 RepID=UPI0007E42F5D|nr:hypothetical protein [Xanthomonas nasturtii]MCL1559781.1 hypothetical protein [Xanthomonas nasturtii]OAX87716.1 hypothetical protein A7D16_14565 [Xanthomonas nasturtii]WVL57176.1 hypothetical protein M3O54_002225 [Xanthomonas nasturtii]